MKLSLMFSVLVFLQGSLTAKAASLTEEILQNEVHFSNSSVMSGSDAVLVLVDVQSGIGPKAVKKDLIAEIARNRLRAFGVRSFEYQRNFVEDLRNNRVKQSDLLTSKLAIEVSVILEDPSLGYSSDCELSFIEVIPAANSGSDFVAQRTWYRRQNLKGISLQDVEDNLVQYIQKELKGFLPAYKSVRLKELRRSKMLKSTKGDSGSGFKEDQVLSYSLRWHDPDNRRNRFLFGISAGTPALGNIHFGFWGGRSFPLVVGASGMYFNTENRGVQLDLGLAFDNSGVLKQVAGLAVMGVNETSRNITYERDEFGRVTTTNTEIVNGLRFYVGPVYTLDWNNFRLQGGLGIRAQQSNQSQVRAMFQIGYTPPIGF